MKSAPPIEDGAPKDPIRSRGSTTTPTTDDSTCQWRVYEQESHPDLGLVDDDGVVGA
jgi:hypothetical protein